MKSSFLKSALVAVVGLALCAPVALHAQATTTTSTSTASKTTTTTKKTAYKGTVKSVDASSIVVTTKKGDLTLAVSSDTKVKVDKKAAAITDITVGEAVTGSYTKGDDGTMTAASVHGTTK